MSNKWTPTKLKKQNNVDKDGVYIAINIYIYLLIYIYIYIHIHIYPGEAIYGDICIWGGYIWICIYIYINVEQLGPKKLKKNNVVKVGL